MQNVTTAVWRGAALAGLALVVACTGGMGAKDGTGEDRSGLSPPKPSCSQLNEPQCLADASCVPEYAPCAMGCTADGQCPPCEPNFVTCRDAAPPPNGCANLDEPACNQSEGCQATYIEACTACGPNEDCPFTCTKTFASCVPVPPADPCANLPEALCLQPFCQPHYGEACLAVYCDPAAGKPCPDVCAPTYAGCSMAVQGCTSNCDCAPNHYCSTPAVPPDVVCSPCAPGVECPPCPFPNASDKPTAPPQGVCVPAPGQGGGSGGSGGGSVPPTDPAGNPPPAP